MAAVSSSKDTGSGDRSLGFMNSWILTPLHIMQHQDFSLYNKYHDFYDKKQYLREIDKYQGFIISRAIKPTLYKTLIVRTSVRPCQA